MSIIKQISVFDGSNWNTDNIGANAGNIDLMNAEGTAASTIAGSTNLLTGLNNILPASKLTASRVLVSNSSGVINTSSVTSTQLGRLSGVSDNVQTQINTLNTNFNNLKNRSITNIAYNIYTAQGSGGVSRVTKTEFGLHVQLSVNYNVNIPSQTDFALLPEGYRPTTEWGLPAIITTDTNISIASYIIIQTNGYIRQNGTNTCRRIIADGFIPF